MKGSDNIQHLHRNLLKALTRRNRNVNIRTLLQFRFNKLFIQNIKIHILKIVNILFRDGAITLKFFLQNLSFRNLFFVEAWIA